MQNGLTDDDRQKISEFLSKPKYERDPEMLIPEEQNA